MPPVVVAAGVGAAATIFASSQQAKAQKSAAASQANALNAQAQAQLEAAKVTANAQIESTRMQTDAAIKASRDAMKAAIQSAALSQEQRIETVIRRLPHESGAATMASFDMAQQWEGYRSMMMYQDVAKEYMTSGKDGRVLHKDPVWNTLNMMDQLKQTALSTTEMVGIRSASNPGGIPLSWEDYKDLHTYKDPDEMLKVDPAVQQKYEADYAKWRSSMYSTAEGKLIVDMYENPQLAGQGIEGLLGTKQPIQVDDSGNVSGGKWSNSGMSKTIDGLKQKGIIDANNMINGGALLNAIPKELRQAPTFNPKKDLSPEDETRLRDRYNNLVTNKAWDPKNIREEYMGYGVTRHTYFNADGTIANQFMSGEMSLADGSVSGQVMIQGASLTEWDKFQGLADGMGPSMPGMFRIGMNEMDPSQLAKSNMAPNAQSRGTAPQSFGMPNLGAPTSGAASRTASNPYQAEMVGNGAPEPSAARDVTPTNINSGTKISQMSQKLIGAPKGTDNAIKPAVMPSGYEGAPLGAGE
jgi:hypothetical protein